MSAPRLLETMRAVGGEIALLDRHLARLSRSARRLGYALDTAAVERRVRESLGERVLGVRLTVGTEGDPEVTTWPLEDAPFRTAWIDPEPLAEAGTVRCTVKSTDRAHYERRYERAQRHGADEAVLVNARGEVVEGTRTSVWAEIDGRLWTPPLSAGGLAGVMRAHVLAADARAGERTLRPDDLRGAHAVYLSNALRGWMAVDLV